MFEHLKKHSVILVTGPQRSGTTICTRMIAHDTGHTYVDEARFGIWNVDRVISVAKENKPCVIQGPGLFLQAHIFPFVVVMDRDIQQINESLKRAPVVYERLCAKHPYVSGDLVVWMYREFITEVRPDVEDLLWQPYRDLKDHPLWVPKEERVDWKLRQWKN